MPLPGVEVRTSARARISPVVKSKTSSIVEPAAGGVAVHKNKPPNPIVPKRETVRPRADFQPTSAPSGPETRAYCRRSSDFNSMMRHPYEPCFQKSELPRIFKFVASSPIFRGRLRNDKGYGLNDLWAVEFIKNK